MDPSPASDSKVSTPELLRRLKSLPTRPVGQFLSSSTSQDSAELQRALTRRYLTGFVISIVIAAADAWFDDGEIPTFSEDTVAEKLLGAESVWGEWLPALLDAVHTAPQHDDNWQALLRFLLDDPVCLTGEQKTA